MRVGRRPQYFKLTLLAETVLSEYQPQRHLHCAVETPRPFQNNVELSLIAAMVIVTMIIGAMIIGTVIIGTVIVAAIVSFFRQGSEAEVSRVICTAGTAAVNPTKGAAFPRQAKPRVVARIILRQIRISILNACFSP